MCHYNRGLNPLTLAVLQVGVWPPAVAQPLNRVFIVIANRSPFRPWKHGAWRRSPGRRRRGFVSPRGPPGAQSDPEGDPGDHGQDPGRRGHGCHRERLEVRCHGAWQTLPHHFYCIHDRCHHRSSFLGSPHHRHVDRETPKYF